MAKVLPSGGGDVCCILPGAGGWESEVYLIHKDKENEIISEGIH